MRYLSCERVGKCLPQSWRRSGWRAFPQETGPRCSTHSLSRRPARCFCRRWSRVDPFVDAAHISSGSCLQASSTRRSC